MTNQEFREQLRSLLGEEPYRKLLVYLNFGGRWKGRFLYWQEQVLARLVAMGTLGDANFERLEPRLRVCDLHDAELVEDVEAVAQWARGAIHSDPLLRAIQALRLDCGPLQYGEKFERQGRWHCPICRDLERQYRTHGLPPATV